MMLASQRTTHRARWFGLLALVVLLGACGEAHVVHREPGYDVPAHTAGVMRHADAGEVEVIHGDTLYGIAFRNGMDFRELAAINGIEAPYTIYVGQILKLRGEHARTMPPTRPVVQTLTHPVRIAPPPTSSGSQTVATTTARSPSPSVPTPFETMPSAALQPAPVASASIASAPMQSAPLQTIPVQPLPEQRVVPAAVTAHTPSAAILPADVATVGGVRWRWPAKGTLLDHFMTGDATKQGIDIAGSAGEAVLAASDGVVVYSGSGLVGYGELIIIKHSDEWLSAYGHNRKRLVQEGQRVKAGQPIAEMGSTGANRDELHFEIRRNGRPVDPQQYLPAR